MKRQPPQEQPPVVRVLVVDDDPFYSAAVRALLDADGRLQVVGHAGDGASAVQRALELRPDVVLMDVLMPIMDGFEATRKIRRRLRGCDVLIVSSYATSRDVAQAEAAGAAGFLTKHRVAEELADAVLAIVAKARDAVATSALRAAPVIGGAR